jgi:hypothetical protein
MTWDDRINRTRCDTCGKFMVQSPGCSFVFVPDSDLTYEENLIQCNNCTSKHGLILPSQSVNPKYCCGIL